jgi:tetratricopeptide (TPR) repeat protein
MTTTAPDYMIALLRGLGPADLPTAVGLLQAAALEHPQDPRPFLLLAGQMASAGHYDQAEAAYMGALERDPDFAIARFQLGLLQFTGGRPTVALLTWAPLDRLPETHPLRCFKVGLATLAEDRFEEAIAQIQQGMALNTDNAPLNEDMARLIERIRQAAAQAPTPGDGDAGPHFLMGAYKTVN